MENLEYHTLLLSSIEIGKSQVCTVKNPTLEQIHKHRSVRKFDPEAEIPQEHIEEIIKAGQRAATSCSGQMYSIIEIPKDIRNVAYDNCGSQGFVKNASRFFIICLDLYRLHNFVDKVGGENQDWPLASVLIGTFDAGLMAQNMVLAAESLGYDTCFCGSCGDRPSELVDALQLPKKVLPLTGLAIGIGMEDPPVRPRISMDMVYHIGKYRNYKEEDFEKSIGLMVKGLDEEGYYEKYNSSRVNYTWRDHLRNKFGGKWLNAVERRRVAALKKQGFLPSDD